MTSDCAFQATGNAEERTPSSSASATDENTHIAANTPKDWALVKPFCRKNGQSRLKATIVANPRNRKDHVYRPLKAIPG